MKDLKAPLVFTSIALSQALFYVFWFQSGREDLFAFLFWSLPLASIYGLLSRQTWFERFSISARLLLGALLAAAYTISIGFLTSGMTATFSLPVGLFWILAGSFSLVADRQPASGMPKFVQLIGLTVLAICFSTAIQTLVSTYLRETSLYIVRHEQGVQDLSWVSSNQDEGDMASERAIAGETIAKLKSELKGSLRLKATVRRSEDGRPAAVVVLTQPLTEEITFAAPSTFTVYFQDGNHWRELPAQSNSRARFWLSPGENAGTMHYRMVNPDGSEESGLLFVDDKLR
jgi:hypothetical protein